MPNIINYSHPNKLHCFIAAFGSLGIQGLTANVGRIVYTLSQM